MVSVVSNAVIMIASMSGFTYLRRSNTSMPDMPAMRMSSTATSIGCFCASSIAVGPSSAISKSYSSLKMTRNDWRGPSSSSTISNVPRRLAGTGSMMSATAVFVSADWFSGQGHIRNQVARFNSLKTSNSAILAQTASLSSTKRARFDSRKCNSSSACRAVNSLNCLALIGI